MPKRLAALSTVGATYGCAWYVVRSWPDRSISPEVAIRPSLVVIYLMLHEAGLAQSITFSADITPIP